MNRGHHSLQEGGRPWHGARQFSRAVAAYDRVLAAGGPMAAEAREQREAVLESSRGARGRALHIETLAAEDARLVAADAERWKAAVGRLRAWLVLDAENQGLAASAFLQEFDGDPRAWLQRHLTGSLLGSKPRLD